MDILLHTEVTKYKETCRRSTFY